MRLYLKQHRLYSTSLMTPSFRRFPLFCLCWRVRVCIIDCSPTVSALISVSWQTFTLLLMQTHTFIPSSLSGLDKYVLQFVPLWESLKRCWVWICALFGQQHIQKSFIPLILQQFNSFYLPFFLLLLLLLLDRMFQSTIEYDNTHSHTTDRFEIPINLQH